jgi:hypothetical protein
MRIRTVVTTGLALAAAAVFARTADAQGGLTFGAGVGGVLNERRDIPTTSRDLNHGLAFVGLSLPTLPLELRGDLLLRDDRTSGQQRAVIASALFNVPLPLVTPYAHAGWGDYNFGDPSRDKWSYGVGLRLNLGAAGLFAEGTHYQRMDTDLVTAGLTVCVGGR